LRAIHSPPSQSHDTQPCRVSHTTYPSPFLPNSSTDLPSHLATPPYLLAFAPEQSLHHCLVVFFADPAFFPRRHIYTSSPLCTRPCPLSVLCSSNQHYIPAPPIPPHHFSATVSPHQCCKTPAALPVPYPPFSLLPPFFLETLFGYSPVPAQTLSAIVLTLYTGSTPRFCAVPPGIHSPLLLVLARCHTTDNTHSYIFPFL